MWFKDQVSTSSDTQRYQSTTISDDETPPPSEFSLTTQRPSVFNPSSITADFNYDSMTGIDTDEGNDIYNARHFRMLDIFSWFSQ